MGSNKQQVQASYDVSNEFFRLWLDEGMNYTCAVFESADQSLEVAQRNKLRILADYARITPDSVVLDIGCGWGANLEYLSTVRKVRAAHGVTLSDAQAQEIDRRGLPGVTVFGCDAREFRPSVRYSAVESICMIDHLVSPPEARAGRAVETYRRFFEDVHRWTAPGAHFALQHIVRNRVPRDKKDLEDVYFCTHVMFPGGLNPRIEEIVQAVNPRWEILEMVTRRLDYQRTTAEWLRRLRLREREIREQWGDVTFADFERYLDTCVRAFERHYSSLAQYSLRRID